MQIRTFTTFFAFFALFFIGNAQNTSISGYVYDDTNGESLIGVTVTNTARTAGAVTNEYGYYSLSVPAGTDTLVFSYLGFEPLKKAALLHVILAPHIWS